MRFTSPASILDAMSELDEFWSVQLAAATQNARLSGRADVADYLSLKAENDAIRSVEVERLFKDIIAAAMSDPFLERQIRIERESPHNFRHRNANLVGSLLRLRHGVRCFTVEAGWTRTPSDGFMRLGALVFARITHFGFPKGNMELAFSCDQSPQKWRIVREEKAAIAFETEDCVLHIKHLIGE